jgi:crotonobetainyl-CoA:carnitine CoA-transferase CaiB-like acyl-CoA transferase
MNLLEGVLVLDFSQFLAGPSAAMRLADFGARVIKIERPDGGDSGRSLTLRNQMADGDAVNFQILNRGKESYAANLKSPGDLENVKCLIRRADVMIHNFRPGIMERMGLDYNAAAALNPRIVYAAVTGYGTRGPWVAKPGQDLLAQSMSGITWLTGSADAPPTGLGLSLADSIAGAHLVQGVLAGLLQREKTGRGGQVEVSLLESVLDLQCENFSTYLNNGRVPPARSRVAAAHADMGAPYGIYRTRDSYIALAMGPVPLLGELLDLPGLAPHTTAQSCMDHRDEINAILAERLKTRTTEHWLSILAGKFWCSEVNTWDALIKADFFQAMELLVDARRPGTQTPIWTSRCPVRVDGRATGRGTHAPRLGADTAGLNREFKTGEKK